MYIDIENKYAPKTLEDFVFPNDEVKNTVMSYATGKRQQPLLLHGVSGTGKSKLATLIPNAIEKGDANIHKIKAVDINTKDGLDMLTRIKENSASGLFNDVMNYCVIEEYEMKLTTISSLKVLLDERIYNDLTIFTSNHFGKIDNAIISRCKSVLVPPVLPATFLPFASKIIKGENVELQDTVLLGLLEEVYDENMDNRKYYEMLSEFVYQINLSKEAA